MNTSEIFNSTAFGPILLKSAAPIAGRHLKVALEENVAYDVVDTEAENNIGNIAKMTGRLISNMDELDLVILFMDVKQEVIEALYQGSIPVSEYYKYHYDNFIIRLSTTLDLCGKIGHLVYETGKREIQANAGSFLKYARESAPQPFETLSALQNYLLEYTEYRHIKVHQGESVDNRFDKITYWKEMLQRIKADEASLDPALAKHTEDQITEARQEIEKILPEMAKLAAIFLDSLVEQLKIVIAKV